MPSQDCATGTSVRLHISLRTRHGDLATMETLLAGDWLEANADRPSTPTRTHLIFQQNAHSRSPHFLQPFGDMPLADSTDPVNKYVSTQSAKVQLNFYMSPLTDLLYASTC